MLVCWLPELQSPVSLVTIRDQNSKSLRVLDYGAAIRGVGSGPVWWEKKIPDHFGQGFVH